MAKAPKTVKTPKTKAPKATKAPAKAKKTPKAKKQEPVIDASDQVYNLLEKLTDEASDEVIRKEGTTGDFIDAAVEINLNTLYHALFNLKFYGGDTDCIEEHVSSILEDFDNDEEFPLWHDGFDDDDDCCGDICNECAAKMQAACPECRRLQEEADAEAAAAEKTEEPKLLN